MLLYILSGNSKYPVNEYTLILFIIYIKSSKHKKFKNVRYVSVLLSKWIDISGPQRFKN